MYVLAVGAGAIDGPVQHDLGDIAGNGHVAGLGFQWQAEAEVALEFGSDLGGVGDAARPSSRYRTRLPVRKWIIYCAEPCRS